MSERWKKQLKVGLTWGGLMTAMMTAWTTYATDVYDTAFFYEIGFMSLFYFSTGILIIGYFSWKKSQISAN